MPEAEKGREQQVVQDAKSGVLEEPLPGSCETVEAATSRLSEAVEAEEKGGKEDESR
jgi:hypothetical protein